MTARKNGTDPEHRDPLSGEKGAHPVGVGVGTAIGAGVAGGALGSAGVAISAGAAAGAAAGPIGAVAGAVVGGIVGGLAGKTIAEKANPTQEHEYWRQNFRSTPFADPDIDYDEYSPAYEYGWESYETYCGRTFEEVEPELEQGWEQAKHDSQLPWSKARYAVKAAWERIDQVAADISKAGEAVTTPDPVCGMEIEPAQAVAQSEYAGENYYFCSHACKEKFDKDPESFSYEA